MTIYVISNPSDPYTIESDNELVACYAVLLLGRGGFGLSTEKDVVMPILLFGGFEEWLMKAFGSKSIPNEWVLENREAIIKALESVLVGSPRDRKELTSALALMPDPAAREQYKQQWMDRRRSSLNNIGGRAHEIAKALRAAG